MRLCPTHCHSRSWGTEAQHGTRYKLGVWVLRSSGHGRAPQHLGGGVRAEVAQAEAGRLLQHGIGGRRRHGRHRQLDGARIGRAHLRPARNGANPASESASHTPWTTAAEAASTAMSLVDDLALPQAAALHTEASLPGEGGCCRPARSRHRCGAADGTGNLARGVVRDVAPNAVRESKYEKSGAAGRRASGGSRLALGAAGEVG